MILTLELTRRLDTLMVPAILATAGAILVTRVFESRSVYSGRIHLGRSAEARSPGRLSSAAKLVELQKALLETEKRPVFVVDEHGTVLGEVTPNCTIHPPPDALPLETATAADFIIRSETESIKRA